MPPITPSEAKGLYKGRPIPEAVFESFNELLSKKGSNYITIKQNDVVNLMVAKGLDKNEIFEKNYLDIEDYYRAMGWKVEYDRPGYNETYEAYFTFTAKG